MVKKSFIPSIFCIRRRTRSLSLSLHSSGSSSDGFTSSRNGMKASLIHAIIVIFLEYFAWGLLTVPVINVLSETFPSNKFLMNGLTLGLKGLLSFLSAPLIGACSDLFGRKKFLFITVFFTCMPIPCLKISPWWYFTFFTLSGLFSVTFSVILAYVADITEKHDRNFAYGMVSATFAASLITSPALGAYIGRLYSDDLVVLVATVVSLLDLLFIILFVPESIKSSNADNSPNFRLEKMTLNNVDPFLVLRLLREDGNVFRLSTILFLSYLSEAGQFSCFFVYLRLVVGFAPETVALFIAFVGILSVISQTFVLLLITQKIGPKSAITLGLLFQFIQLVCYGLGSTWIVMWGAGFLAALSQITYPALSAFVSVQTDKELQGTVQGILSGIRGLCQGIGPALFGFAFYIFNMDLSLDDESAGHIGVGPQFPVPNVRTQSAENKVISPVKNITQERILSDTGFVPGPPFLFGALLVFIALLLNVSLAIPGPGKKIFRRTLFSSTVKLQRGESATLIDPNLEKE